MAGNLDQAEDLAARVVRACIHTGVRHPLGKAWSCLGQIADHRGDDEEALAYLEKAATLYRELDDPWQLGDSLVELATYEATMARYTEAMRDLTEAVRLREQMNSQPNPFLQAVVAYVHHARGETAMATGALGAYEATGHTSAWATDDFRRPRTLVCCPGRSGVPGLVLRHAAHRAARPAALDAGRSRRVAAHTWRGSIDSARTRCAPTMRAHGRC
jgi:tetratricopeptide (TPR) repeat protein